MGAKSGIRGIGRRVLRGVRRALSKPGPWFVHHPDYRIGLPGVPLDPLRSHRILAFLLDEGLAGPADVSTPVPASLERIGLVHSRRYLDALDRPEALEPVLGFTVTDEESHRIIDHQRLVAGGTIHAARLALKTGRLAVNLGGGFHHAAPDRGLAFCVFNDVAVAIARLRRKRFDEPVLVVDLDLHDGNGTRAAFATDHSVFTFSVHNEGWDPTEAVADLSVELGADVDDDRYLSVIESGLPAVIETHRPGLVFYVAGADPAADDPIGNWRISPETMLRRDRFVVEQVARFKAGTPLVVVLGGGYGDDAWLYPARFLASLVSGEAREPEMKLDSVVRMYRRIERESNDAVATVDADWTLSEDDLGLKDLSAGDDNRFLGVMSEYAVELSLERFGILAQLRARGFRHPSVKLQATPPLGHTLRIFGDADGRVLLIEQRVSRNRSLVAGTDLFYAEWLMLQNPRAEFGENRRPLPGQQHPGLGLLREIVAWWVVLCERLRLDGILFVPSHYYMAVLGRRHMRFLKPEDEAMTNAFRRALRGLNLTEATEAVDAGRVVRRSDGSPVAWHSPILVLPVGDRLLDGRLGGDWPAAVRRAGATLDFRLS